MRLKKVVRALPISFFLIWSSAIIIWPVNVVAGKFNPEKPKKIVKLIFIHHSCGENWLSDNNGGLARMLQKNNYFVSDTNYGWGPDSIGDRTDIENWPQWFTGPQSGRYLQALYNESGQNSSYRRVLSDPGGENRIVMFKSCFPNSNLEGRPGDPPGRGQGLTVANAKAIYNELLKYFQSRPDKLFVAVTAPPVQDRTHGKNARAFNTWLVKDWLKGCQGNNVVVFDFYNILTGQGNHHCFKNGRIQFVNNKGRNTLVYPTDPGDDHPNSTGNRKATAEFLPLLNVYYNQWQKSAPPQSQTGTAPQTKTAARTAPQTTVKPVAVPGLIDNFDIPGPEWQIFMDGSKGTDLKGVADSSRARSGKYSLKIDYRVKPEGWATYSLIYDAHRDWRSKAGIVVYVHAEKEGQPIIITVYNGPSSDSLRSFEYKAFAGPQAVKGWQRIEIPWNKFVQPPWEGDGTARFDPGASLGLAFIFSPDDSAPIKGRLWVDDIQMLSAGK